MACATDYSVITNEETIIVDTQEEVTETEVVVEYFVQPDRPDNLDVLVVLDTSCSMRDNYENVSAGLDILRGDIETLTSDYQMAFINSSLSEPYFAGVLGPDSTSMDIYLAPYSLGSDTTEMPFGSLYMFSSTPEGEQFLREGVDKLYIFVSDEPEQSPIPVSLFKEWMDEYHEGVTHDAIVIGINEDSDCDTGYTPGSGTENRFLALANYYNKNIIDICGDFQLALAENSFLIRPVTHMQLERQPVEESIVVYKSGVVQQDWYYLTSTNTVYFEFEVEEGAVIKIGYNSHNN